MKSHHFVLKSRSEPSTGNASAQVTENPLVGTAWTFQPGWWDPLVSPKEMSRDVYPLSLQGTERGQGSWSHRGYSPQVPAVSSMFPWYHVLWMAWYWKRLSSAGLICYKGCCHLLHIKFRTMQCRMNTAVQWQSQRSRLCPSSCFATLSTFWFCFSALPHGHKVAATASHIMSSLQGFMPEENK